MPCRDSPGIRTWDGWCRTCLGYRELPIDFGTVGYVALYRVDGDQVTVVALRAGRERGYGW